MIPAALLAVLAMSACELAAAERPGVPAAPAAGRTPASAPSAPSAEDTWGSPASAGETPGAAWRGATQFPLPRDARVTYPPTTCPVAMIGTQVVDLSTGHARDVDLPKEHSWHELRTLSGDGKLLAMALEAKRDLGTPVGVFALETGEKLAEIPGGGGDRSIGFLAFSGTKWLLIGVEHSRQSGIEVWEIATNRMIRKIKAESFGRQEGSVTGDGRYLAFMADDNVFVYEVHSGQRLATMRNPPAHPRGGAPADPKGGAPADSRRTVYDSAFRLGRMWGLQFSPSGRELAGAFSQEDGVRLVCWNTRGEIVWDEEVAVQVFDAREEGLTWAPDGSGWLLAGQYLVDRRSKKLVWVLPVHYRVNPAARFLDASHVLASGDGVQLRVWEIPWAAIRKSLAAMSDKTPSLVRPGQSVTLAVNVTGAIGDPQQAKTMIVEALTKRLARDKIKVADGQAAVLSVRLAEKQGEALKIVEKQNPFDIHGHDTGRTAREASGDLVVELLSSAGGEPFWSQTLRAESGRSFNEDINDQTMRKSMLEQLTRRMSGLELPYFVPATTEVDPLPVIASD
jgi:hypothetical protein